MNVVDFFGWPEYFAAGKNVAFFPRAIEDTSRAHGATLWTQDADFEGRDGVRYVPA